MVPKASTRSSPTRPSFHRADLRFAPAWASVALQPQGCSDMAAGNRAVLQGYECDDALSAHRQTCRPAPGEQTEASQQHEAHPPRHHALRCPRRPREPAHNCPRARSSVKPMSCRSGGVHAASTTPMRRHKGTTIRFRRPRRVSRRRDRSVYCPPVNAAVNSTVLNRLLQQLGR